MKWSWSKGNLQGADAPPHLSFSSCYAALSKDPLVHPTDSCCAVSKLQPALHWWLTMFDRSLFDWENRAMSFILCKAVLRGLAHAAISLLSDITSGHARPVTKCRRIVGIRLLWLSAATNYSPPPNSYSHISGGFSNQENMFLHHNHPLFTLSHSPVDLGEAPQSATLAPVLCQITSCPYGDKQCCMSTDWNRIRNNSDLNSC